MYLKNIEVYGFKSFAQKINFEFHNGITGIVGPNGSGKSNVGDAVRWVLGEQSAKQLRGGNMQDVIFSGTESRKPLSFASVAITLDNSDHKLPVQLLINRHLNKMNIDDLVNENMKKMEAKRAKEGLPPQKITNQAHQSVKNINKIDKGMSGSDEANRAKKVEEAYQNASHAKAGSITAKANMVKAFDEKNKKK